MRGFIPFQNEDGRVAPWEYLPCSAVTLKLGMAMVLSSGNLATDVFLLHPYEFTPVTYDADEDRTLAVYPPHDKLYA